MDVDDRLREIEARFEQVQADLASPETAADPNRLRTLGKSYAELEAVVRPFREYRRALDDSREAAELAAAERDPEMAEAFEDRSVELALAGEHVGTIISAG